MSSASEAAGAIDGLRQQASELAGKVNSSKGQAEAMAGALEGIGAEDKSKQVSEVANKLEAAEASRAGFEGTLAKAHFMMLSVMRGSMGSGASTSASAPGHATGAAPPHTDFTAANDLIDLGKGLDDRPEAIPPESIAVPTDIRTEDEPDPDSQSGRFQRFGRIGVREAEDLSQFAAKVEKSANELDDLFKPPPDPHSYNTGTQVPEPPPISRAADDTQSSGSLEWVGTAVVLSVLMVESVSRLAKRKRDD